MFLSHESIEKLGRVYRLTGYLNDEKKCTRLAGSLGQVVIDVRRNVMSSGINVKNPHSRSSIVNSQSVFTNYTVVYHYHYGNGTATVYYFIGSVTLINNFENRTLLLLISR